MGLFKNSKPVQPLMTPEEKCLVLGELWLNHRDAASDDESWGEFFNYNDIGLPLSYMVYADLVLGLAEDASTIINETWDMFCSYIDIDPAGNYASLQEAFTASPNPLMEVDDGPAPRSSETPKDYGLEAFMGTRVDAEPADIKLNKRGLNVSNGAWRQISRTCDSSSGGNVARARLFVLPCQCGGYRSGIDAVDTKKHDDVAVGHGMEVVVMDPESAEHARGSSLDADARGFYLTLGDPSARHCECGDNWKPTMAVAASALALGLVNRNYGVARTWYEDHGAEADHGDFSGADSDDPGGGDFDFGMDFGGF